MSLTRVQISQLDLAFDSDDNLVLTTDPVTGATVIGLNHSVNIESDINACNVTCDDVHAGNVTVDNVICNDVIADNVRVNVSTANTVSTTSPFILDGFPISTATYQGSTALMFNGAPVAAYGNQVLVGHSAGLTNQGAYSIAVGYLAGTTNQGNVAVAIGDQAGKINQGNNTIGIGYAAGEINQGQFSVAMGYGAGMSKQGQIAVAIGDQAGKINQGAYAIAMGFAAGEIAQGHNSIAIGAGAGYSALGNNTIFLNATGNSLTSTTPNAFYVKPVRSVTGATSQGFVSVFYNPTTGEFVYGTP